MLIIFIGFSFVYTFYHLLRYKCVTKKKCHIGKQKKSKSKGETRIDMRLAIFASYYFIQRISPLGW